jgi:hypothetical protein
MVSPYSCCSRAGWPEFCAKLRRRIVENPRLLHHPDQFELVRNDLLLVPGLVDEGLRWATPAKHFMRNATRDAEELSPAASLSP